MVPVTVMAGVSVMAGMTLVVSVTLVADVSVVARVTRGAVLLVPRVALVPAGFVLVVPGVSVVARVRTVLGVTLAVVGLVVPAVVGGRICHGLWPPQSVARFVRYPTRVSATECPCTEDGPWNSPWPVAVLVIVDAHNLMAGPPPTHLPTDPASAELAAGADPAEVARRHPASPAAWAALATRERSEGGDPLTGYAYARVGYHRSLDLLRRNGWKGHGLVPWEREPNRGFLTCLALLALAAREIGETDEWDRCSTFLRESSATAAEELLGDVAQ